MDFHEYASAFEKHRKVADVQTFARVNEGSEDYSLLVASVPGRRTLLITAGFHGDETAGPLTLLAHLPEIVDEAQSRGVGLRVYPCLNPSGFTDGTRYNRSKEQPNNDFLRYEVAPGRWVDSLASASEFLRHVVFVEGPKETRALCGDLESQPTPDAALDIHQDPWLGGARTYAYTFGDRAAYLPLLGNSERHLAIARDTEVDDDVHTDGYGLIELHDGSVTDYFHRRGVPLTAALETTTAADLRTCHAVNLVWIKGFIDLVADA